MRLELYHIFTGSLAPRLPDSAYNIKKIGNKVLIAKRIIEQNSDCEVLCLSAYLPHA